MQVYVWVEMCWVKFCYNIQNGKLFKENSFMAFLSLWMRYRGRMWGVFVAHIILLNTELIIYTNIVST